MKPLLTAFTFFVFCFSLKAQKIEQFFDWKWQLTDASTARYYTLMEKKDTVWHRQDYFIHESRLQMDGSYQDPDSKIAHGYFHYYHANGQLASQGLYLKGKRQGLWLRYHDNGMLNDSAIYEQGNVVGTKMAWHRNGFLADSAVLNADGSGVSVSWFDNGSPAAAGRYATGGKLEGKWQYFHSNGQLSAVEIYQQDVLLSKTYFDETGHAITDTTSTDREASFPGGDKAWMNFLSKQLYFPAQWKIANADQAVVVVDWVVDEQGYVRDVRVQTPFHPAFENLAVEAISRSPRWLPAIAHYRKIKAYRRQPVTFQQE